MKFIKPDAQPGISEQIMKNLNTPAPSPTENVQVGSGLYTQPTDAPDVPNLEQMYPNEIREYSIGTGPDQVFDDSTYKEAKTASEGDPKKKEEFRADLFAQMRGEQDIKVLRNDNQAMGMLADRIRQYENRNNKGLIIGAQGEVFTVFDVPDSPIGEKDIGWGFKVEPEMLTDDRSKWPKVNGVPVDLRKGIDLNTANALLYQELEKAQDLCKAQVPNWEKTTPMEKFFWIDLAYNSGPETFKKSPKAMAAAKAGYTAEAAIKSLDFIYSGKGQMKGLFNRRIESYNEMAKELPGVPLIEEAEWGEEVKVKFAHKVQSTKVSNAFTNKINNTGDGWFTVTKGVKGRKTEKYKI